LNGCGCRLKDINELFYDTGIGKEGYSIIGQGQIDRILSGKPEERRELFDEAVGIVKVKRRKNTALKKLEAEQQNLIRVNDILSELERQIGPLEKQSETARAYLKEREELEDLEAGIFCRQMEQQSRQLASLEENIDNVRKELEEHSRSFEQTKDKYEKLEEQIEQLEEQTQQKREESSRQAVRRQELEGQVNVLREQINAERLRGEHYRERIDSLKAEMRKRRESESSYRQEKKTLEEERDKAEQRWEEDKKQMEKIQQGLTACISDIEEGKSRLIEILNERASIKGKMQRYDAMMEQIQIRRSGLNQRILRMKTDGQHLQESFASYRKKY